MRTGKNFKIIAVMLLCMPLFCACKCILFSRIKKIQPSKQHLETVIDAHLHSGNEQRRKNVSSVTKCVEGVCAFFNKGTVHKRTHTQRVAYVTQQEAQQLDVPLPLAVEPMLNYVPQVDALVHNSVCAYTSSDTVADLAAFYTVEMERFGWQSTSQFIGYEQLLCFGKPQRICIVSLRPYHERFNKQAKTQLVLYVKPAG